MQSLCCVLRQADNRDEATNRYQAHIGKDTSNDKFALKTYWQLKGMSNKWVGWSLLGHCFKYVTHTSDDFANLNVVDGHLADLALGGVPNLLSSPLLSWDDLPEKLRRQIILLSLLGLHERLGKQLPGRCGNLLGIT